MAKIIDITFDFETLSLASNAAVLQLAAVVFDRSACDLDELFPKQIAPFESKVDIRSCVADGFDFSPSTVKWWSEKPDEVKREVLTGDCYPLKEVMENFIDWIKEVLAFTGADTPMLWAQGSDFDISVLRTILRRYDLEKQFPVHFHNNRDARTFIAEIGSRYFGVGYEGLADHRRIYDAMPPFPQEGNAHSADYDCRRTSWAIWQCFSMLPDAY